MAPTLSGIGLVTLLSLLIYRYIIKPGLLSPLSKLPNTHWSSPFTTLHTDKHYTDTGNARLFRRVQRAHERYGSVVRVGPKEVSINSAESVQQVYTSNLVEKDPWYQMEFAAQFGHSPMFSIIDRDTHTARRRLVTGVYAKSFLLASPDLSQVAGTILKDALFPILRDAAKEDASLNVLALFQYAAADLLSAYELGSANGSRFLQNEDPREEYFGAEVVDSWFMHREGGGKLFLDKTIDAIATLNKPQDAHTRPVVLSKVYDGLKASKQYSDDGLEKGCASELLDNLVAGHEGIAITLTYAMWEMSKRPDLQAALRKEISSVGATSPDPLISAKDGSNVKLPSLKELDELPLLHRILWETLRLHSAAPSMQPRIVGAGGMEIHGFYMPPGTKVSANAYSLHRNQEAFADPASWNPDRWVPGEKQPDKKWFWPFSSGGHGCIGKTDNRRIRRPWAHRHSQDRTSPSPY